MLGLSGCVKEAVRLPGNASRAQFRAHGAFFRVRRRPVVKTFRSEGRDVDIWAFGCFWWVLSAGEGHVLSGAVIKSLRGFLRWYIG